MTPKKTASEVVLLRITDGADDIAARLPLLLERGGVGDIASKNDIVAVKLHFGESNETGHVRPRFVRRIVAWASTRGFRPFVTDTNTLYRGARSDSISHLKAAAEHGFTQSAIGAPIIIADGMHGTSETRLASEGSIVREAPVASELVKADALLSVAHFKGHELSGFGGAIKNVGMGGASRAGKLDQHSTTKPYVREGCTACGTCTGRCPADAISIDPTASIDESLCIGCGECIAVCPERAIGIRWNESTDTFQKKMVEYLAAIAAQKRGRMAYVNFITDVHPVCDCYGTAKIPIVPDVGVVASRDPIAIDQASYDLVNAAPVSKESEISRNYRQGGDKFRDLHKDVDPAIQLRHGEELGLGTRNYELVEI